MRPSNKKRKPIRALAITSGSILIIIVAAAFYLQNRVGDILIKEINKQLTARVRVKEVSFSFFRGFPNAQLRFTDVLVPDPFDQDTPLLEAGTLSLNFSIIDIIRKNYNIRFIGIEEGSLSLAISETGEPNYLIIKQGDAESAPVRFALRKVRVNNVKISYNDKKNNIIANVNCTRTVFRGDFSADEYNTRMTGDVSIQQVKVGNESFFSGQNSFIDIILNVDNIKSIYTFTRGELEVEGLPFQLKGNIRHTDKHKRVALSVEGDNMKIAHLLKLLPAELGFIETEYTPKGTVNFAGKIEGSYAGNNIPGISFSFSIEKGSVDHKKSGISLDNIAIQGVYNYSGKKNDLEIRNFSAKLGDGNISGNAELINLNNPTYKLHVNTDINITDLLSFYPLKNISGGSGKVQINLTAETLAEPDKSLSVTHLLNSRSTGNIKLSDVAITNDNGRQLLSGISGNIEIENNDVTVTNLRGIVLDNRISFEGIFRNLLPYLLTDDQSLEFSGNLRSPSMDLKKMLFYNNTADEGEKAGATPVKIPERIYGSLDIAFDRLVYDNFTPYNIRAELRISPGLLLADKVYMTAFNGRADGAVMLAQEDGGSFRFDCALNTDRVDISQMFKQLNNFGQSDLTYQNLEGLLSSKIRIMSGLTPGLIFRMPSLEALGELTVENGALLNYEPVKALARYTRLNDLSNIRFNTLKNEIRIADEKIIIPEMMIRSDAVDLSVAGVHTFDGDINYQVRILLSELLSGKAKKINRQRTDIDLSEEDQKGRITIYLLIEGTADDPVVKYDRKGRRTKVKDELKAEKEEMRDLFKKEFGIFNRSNEKTVKQGAKENEGTIIIEWDDE